MSTHKHAPSGAGYIKGCPGCQQLARERRRDSPAARARHAAANRRRNWVRWGIDPVEAEAALASHNGVCPLCGRVKPGGRGDWHVDHDHATGKVRGILCGNCNRALGYMEDNPARLRAAADYLEKHA